MHPADVSRLSDGLADIANALQKLGLNDAATPMGAIEALSKAQLDSAELIHRGLTDVAEAIRESNDAR